MSCPPLPYWRPITMTLYGAGALSSAETEEPSKTEEPAEIEISAETEAAAVCSSLLFSFVRKRRGPRKASLRPNRRAMKPTSRAAMIVPSLTPSRRWAKRRERTAAMTASYTSKATFVDPNSVFHVEDTARTNDSPGSIATSARTSVYTPNPRITHPISR